MSKIISKENQKKIIMMIVIIMLFNFVMPNYSQAGLLLNFFGRLTLIIPDKLLEGLENIFIGEDSIKNNEGKYSIKLSPGTIFAGEIPAFDANFIDPTDNIIRKKEDQCHVEEVTNVYDGEVTGIYWIAKFAVENELVTKPADWMPDNSASNDEWDDDRGANLVGEYGNNIFQEKYIKEYANSLSDTKEVTRTVTASNGATLTVKYYCRAVDTYAEWGYDTENSDKRYEYTINKCEVFTSGELADSGQKELKSTAGQLRGIIATWYKILRNFSLVGLLSVLVYISIRMIISSASSQKARYKKMLMGWFEAICILFVLQFMMSLGFTVVQSITDVFAEATVKPNGEDALMSEIRNNIEEEKEDDEYSNAFFDILLYLVLVIYTISFGVQYLKRVVYLAFLTFISPLIALTYPLDKVKDGKAQAFEVWMKEFIFNLLIQPIHLILYNMLVINAMTLVNSNKVYALIAIGALLPAEKFIRKMFGLDSSESSGKMASTLGGAAVMNSINKLGHKPPLGKTGRKQETSKEKTKIRKPNQGIDVYSALRNTGGTSASGTGASGTSVQTANSTGNINSGTTRENASTQSTTQTVQKTSIPMKRKIKGVGKVVGKYGKSALRGMAKATGAVTLGTIGLAAGIATGDMSNALMGLAGGAASGSKLGGNLADGVSRLPKATSKAIDDLIVNPYREGAYGKDEAEKIRFNEEFMKSEDYKKLMQKHPGQEKTTKEILKAGITDTKKMGKALTNVEKGKYKLDEAIAYMKMAEKCPNKILYDETGFREYLNSYGINEDRADAIRKEVIAFK